MTNEPDPAAKLPTHGPNPRTIWLGAATGIAPTLATALVLWGNPGFRLHTAVSLIFASQLLWPLAAIPLACFGRSRRFGLGMLLGAGVGWLTLLAICGGTLLLK